MRLQPYTWSVQLPNEKCLFTFVKYTSAAPVYLSSLGFDRCIMLNDYCQFMILPDNVYYRNSLWTCFVIAFFEQTWSLNVATCSSENLFSNFSWLFFIVIISQSRNMFVEVALGNLNVILSCRFCTSGGNCQDKDRRCPGWMSHCSNNDYVKKNCKKTCRLCGGTQPGPGPSCSDKDRRCSRWRKLCNSHPYVKNNCKRTCRRC
jgi:hypothetical protein